MIDLIDLRGMQFMPLYIERLQKSKAWLQCKRDPALAFYLMNLWMRAWHEIPAGSIEDDDDVLCDASMCEPRQWGKLKQKILRGWEKREDGRLYHAVVTEYAAEAWEGRKAYRDRLIKAREAKQQKRHRPETPPVTGDVIEPIIPSIIEPDIDLKGKGQCKGQGEGESPLPPLDPAIAVIRQLDAAISEAFGAEQARPYPHATDRVIAGRMLAAGATPELLDGVFLAICQRMKSQSRRRPDGLKFFEGAVSDAIAEAGRSLPKPNEPIPPLGQHIDHERFRWKARLASWKTRELWDADWGPSPGQPNCCAPQELLAEIGIERTAA